MEKELTEILCCPFCREGEFLCSDSLYICSICHRRYPIEQGRPILVPFVADNGKDAEVLLAAAKTLQPRDQVLPWKDNGGLEVEKFFFSKLFHHLDRRVPQWEFLGSKVREMVNNISKGAKVLDIGAGECKYAALLPHCHYVGTDLVFSSDKHDFSHIDVVADASTLPFRNESFDVALNLVILEHVPDPALTVCEMARILKPGGIAFALIPLVRPEHLVPFDFQRFTRYGIQRLFENNGFQIDSIEGSNGALWTAVHYAHLLLVTQPLIRYGRRSLRGMVMNRVWSFILWPLVSYARITNRAYGDEFPIYFWVRAARKND